MVGVDYRGALHNGGHPRSLLFLLLLLQNQEWRPNLCLVQVCIIETLNLVSSICRMSGLIRENPGFYPQYQLQNDSITAMIG